MSPKATRASPQSAPATWWRSNAAGGVPASLRVAQPLVELRVPFVVSRARSTTVERGAQDADWQPVKDAAKQIAFTEDRAIFDGFAAAGIAGIRNGSSNPAIALPADVRQFPDAVAQALTTLRLAGVDGPYSLLLSADAYTKVTESTDHGYPVIKHLTTIIDGEIIWAPAIDGAFLLSARGGDFELHLGQDLSIGYLSHDAEQIKLYFQETLTFLVHRRGKRGPRLVSIRTSVTDHIAEVVVDAPPVNALTVAGWFELAEAIIAAGADPDVRVVVLAAEGKGFNAGVDIKEMQSTEGFSALVGANRGCAAAFAAVYDCPVPVIAAVQGFCLGGGIGLVGNADIIVAVRRRHLRPARGQARRAWRRDPPGPTCSPAPDAADGVHRRARDRAGAGVVRLGARRRAA